MPRIDRVIPQPCDVGCLSDLAHRLYAHMTWAADKERVVRFTPHFLIERAFVGGACPSLAELEDAMEEIVPLLDQVFLIDDVPHARLAVSDESHFMSIGAPRGPDMYKMRRSGDNEFPLTDSQVRLRTVPKACDSRGPGQRAQARALSLSSSSISRSDSDARARAEPQPEPLVPIPADLPLTDDARGPAEMAGLQDIELEWLRFVAKHQEPDATGLPRLSTLSGWYAKWRGWWPQSLKYQRLERERARSRGPTRGGAVPGRSLDGRGVVVAPEKRAWKVGGAK